MTLEKEALEQRITYGESIGLPQNGKVDQYMNEGELARQNGDNKRLHHHFKENEYILMNVNESLKDPYVAQSQK